MRRKTSLSSAFANCAGSSAADGKTFRQPVAIARKRSVLAGALPWIEPVVVAAGDVPAHLQALGAERLLRALEQPRDSAGRRRTGRPAAPRPGPRSRRSGRSARRGSRRSRRRRCSGARRPRRSAPLTVSGVAPGHGFDALTGLPENGSTVPPSSTRSNQRVSLSCWLSARSPVVIAKPSFARLPPRPRSSLVRLAFMLRTVWSKTCSSSASCGRHEEQTRVARRVDEVDPRRRHLVGDLRVGELAEERQRAPLGRAVRRRPRRRVAADPVVLARPRAQRREAAAAGAAGSSRSVVDLPAGSASATGAVSASRARAPRTAERADMARDADAKYGTAAPVNRRPRLELHGSSAAPEEAAAVIAAIEQFLRDTAPPVAPGPDAEPVGQDRVGGRRRSRARALGLGVTGRHDGPIGRPAGSHLRRSTKAPGCERRYGLKRRPAENLRLSSLTM